MHAVTRKFGLAGGIIALLAALLPPLASMAEHLFSAHMGQHLILIAVAAPLIAWSWPKRLRFAPSYVWAWCGFVGIFLLWHWPVAFRWAAGSFLTEALELGSILIAATLFWLAAVGPFAREQMSEGAAALFVMTAAVATDLPGVIMVFAPSAICTMPAENAAAFGLTPLQDQQIAGMLMWVPANLIFFGIATALFARWMSEREHQPVAAGSSWNGSL